MMPKLIPIFNRLIVFFLLALLFAITHTAQANRAQPTAVTDITIMNLSNTPTSSVDPFLIADRTGVAHLFWSEDVGGRVVMGGTTAGNTIMYARWDGASWSQPIDILLTPLDALGGFGDPKAWQPEAIIDDFGTIHLIWLGQYPDKLYYSSAPASDAGRAGAWSEPVALAADSTGTQYAIDIEYVPATNTLHIVYARGHWEEQYSGEDPRAITHIFSTDGGANWSDPVDIAFTPDPERGYSNLRLLFAPETRLFASWTEWDQTGNGQAVWVARSLDNGRSWDPPVKLAERSEGEYERDWTKLAWLGGDELVATWEGGFRAYRHLMYSDDAGQTWSEPHDTFYWLIGENGFVEFARDGADNLHFFIAQRIREGTVGRTGGLGLWHSTWLDDSHWSDTQLIGGLNDMVNPRVVILNGNQIVASWYASTVGEILVLNATLTSVPGVTPQEWLVRPETAVSDTLAEGTLPSGVIENSTTIAVQDSIVRQNQHIIQSNMLNAPVLLGMMTASLLVGGLILVRWQAARRKG